MNINWVQRQCRGIQIVEKLMYLPNEPEQSCGYSEFGCKQISHLTSLHRLATLGRKHRNKEYTE